MVRHYASFCRSEETYFSCFHFYDCSFHSRPSPYVLNYSPHMAIYRILVQVCFWPFLINVHLRFQINLETHLPLYNHCPPNRYTTPIFNTSTNKIHSVQCNNTRSIKTHFIRTISLTQLYVCSFVVIKHPEDGTLVTKHVGVGT